MPLFIKSDVVACLYWFDLAKLHLDLPEKQRWEAHATYHRLTGKTKWSYRKAKRKKK